MKINRDLRIDILRCIALIGIIIAHINPPAFLFQLRSFDVPLMTLLMGTSFYLSSQGKEVNYVSYLFKRIKRLLFPTWKFLTIFFLLFLLLSFVLGQEYYYDLSTIITSYTLFSGIGYVWVIQVFLAVAILNPIILIYSNTIKNNKTYLLLLGFFYILYVLLIIFDSYLIGNISQIYKQFILYSIGYGLIAAIGMRLKKFTNKELKMLVGLFSVIFVVLMFENNFALTNIAKYPPTMYYISYALAASITMYLLLENKIIFNIFNRNSIYFVSKNSLWFYFWHIIPVTIINLYGSEIYLIEDSFLARFVFVIVITTIITHVQNMISKKMKIKKIAFVNQN